MDIQAKLYTEHRLFLMYFYRPWSTLYNWS